MSIPSQEILPMRLPMTICESCYRLTPLIVPGNGIQPISGGHYCLGVKPLYEVEANKKHEVVDEIEKSEEYDLMRQRMMARRNSNPARKKAAEWYAAQVSKGK